MDLMLFDDAAALAPPRVEREDLPGGGFVLRHADALQAGAVVGMGLRVQRRAPRRRPGPPRRAGAARSGWAGR